MIIDEKTRRKLEKLVEFELKTCLKTTTELRSKELWEQCKKQIEGFMMDEAMATTGHTSFDLNFYKDLIEKYEKASNLLGFDLRKELKETAVNAIIATINDLYLNYDIVEPCPGPFDSPFLFIPSLLEFFKIELYEHEVVIQTIKKACEVFLEDGKNYIFIDLIYKTGFMVNNDKKIVEKIKDNIRKVIYSYGEDQYDFGPEMVKSLIEIGDIDPATLNIPVASFLTACHEVDNWIVGMANVLYPSDTCND